VDADAHPCRAVSVDARFIRDRTDRKPEHDPASQKEISWKSRNVFGVRSEAGRQGSLRRVRADWEIVMLYAIGDDGADIESQFELFSTFENIVHMTFDELMITDEVLDENAGIILFFPYRLWNTFVETNNGLYGGRGFKANILELKNHLHEKLELVFPGALYVNEPDVFALERDKLETKNLLRRNNISVVPDVPKDISTIENELTKGNCIYVKVRYGSMGKGITRLEKGKWLTNFRYANGAIDNHPSDFEWKTIDVTDNNSFLEKLLEEDVMVERAVETPRELGSKFDIRGVYVYGRLAELYGRASNNPLITNLSQGGGCLESSDLIGMLGEDKLAEAVHYMYDANMVFGTNLLGVDLTFDKDLKPFVMEVNSFPGLGHGITEEKTRDALLRDVHSKMMNEHAMKKQIIVTGQGSVSPVRADPSEVGP
jgi:glutathione synthase/RimK-type ligase-like ATP-grasp enzyme